MWYDCKFNLGISRAPPILNDNTSTLTMTSTSLLGVLLKCNLLKYEKKPFETVMINCVIVQELGNLTYLSL